MTKDDCHIVIRRPSSVCKTRIKYVIWMYLAQERGEGLDAP